MSEPTSIYEMIQTKPPEEIWLRFVEACKNAPYDPQLYLYVSDPKTIEDLNERLR